MFLTFPSIMAKGNQGNLSFFNEIQVGDVILEFSHPLKINAFQSNSYVRANDYRWWLHFCLYVCSPLTGGNVLPWFDSCIYVAGGSDKKPTKTPWIGAVIEAQPLAPVMYGDDFSYPVICWEYFLSHEIRTIRQWTHQDFMVHVMFGLNVAIAHLGKKSAL